MVGGLDDRAAECVCARDVNGTEDVEVWVLAS